MLFVFILSVVVQTQEKMFNFTAIKFQLATTVVASFKQKYIPKVWVLKNKTGKKVIFLIFPSFCVPGLLGNTPQFST